MWQLLLSSRFVLYAKKNFAMMAIQGMVGSNDRDDEKHTEQVRSLGCLGWMMLDLNPSTVMLRPATAFISGCNCKNKTNPTSSGLCSFFWNPIPAYGLKLHFPIFTTPYFCATCRIARYTQRMLLMEVQGFSRLARPLNGKEMLSPDGLNRLFGKLV